MRPAWGSGTLHLSLRSLRVRLVLLVLYFRVAVETRQLPTRVTRLLALLDEVLASRSR